MLKHWHLFTGQKRYWITIAAEYAGATEKNPAWRNAVDECDGFVPKYEKLTFDTHEFLKKSIF